MEKEVFILTKEELDEFRRECEQFAINEFTGRHTDSIDFPSPVKVLTDVQIINMARLKAYDVPDYELGFEAGYNACLSDLGLK